MAFVFYKDLIEIVKLPIEKANLAGADLETSLSVFSPVEGFMSVIKICLYAGLISSFPLLLYFIGELIIPGLNEKEKKLIIPVVFGSFILFATGVLFAYYVVIPRALVFFDTFNSGVGIDTDLRFKYTVSFVTMLSLVFGLCFELPVVVLTLVKLGLLDSKMMRATRSYAIVAMFVLAAVITPLRPQDLLGIRNFMGSLKKRRKPKINNHKRRKRMRANRHKKRLRYKS